MDERISSQPGVNDDQHTNKVHDQYGEESQLIATQDESDGVAYDPINVRQVNETASGSYQTIVIPASTSTVTSAQLIIPADPFRSVAYVSAVNVAVIIASTLQEAQAAGNIASAVPAGASQAIGAWSPPIRHKGPVYAANTSTASAALVSVMVERSDTAE